MEDIKANLFPCAHCEGTGTCRNGKNKTSCQACIKSNELKGKEFEGLLCGSCGGLGQTEPYTERLNKRIKPILSMVIVLTLLIMLMILSLLENPHFTEILAFSTTLIGTIIAYYFSSTKNKKA